MANLVISPQNGTSTLIAPDGSVAVKANVELTAEEAMLLRRYKKFLAKMGLREAIYCQACWNSTREDGCKAYVTDASILIECRCKTRLYKGMNF